ncbi:DUF2927 domain-containing protein [Tateyamaria omphalii]|uniref:ATP-dependent transcriptional regulator n=1 Tax=Tateyamaria omphalii TaxID=299262 RepID=A0A1P8N0B5_9RHOB|nr:DUF2927 domain-containing protein [Tateyamaria omphalii]APX13723.1 ATP-dependent transcriptional regulator [Tateyamaria omphalii]
MRRFALPLVLLLNACAPVTPGDTPTRALPASSDLPPMKTFGAPRPVQPVRSNNDLALDFIELSFQLESGRALPVFTRFEGPISVRVTGKPPASLGTDLRRLMHRLRTEAHIDIYEAAPGNAANITIEAVSRSDIRKALPHAACFVVPNITTISEYKPNRRTPRTSWSNLRTRERLAIFLPNDASPQEVRDCLHEELAQAIGPLNDLYRLPDSVFNDDNVHTVLTGFDMLMLKAYYSPELRSGMTRGQVAQRLPQILARINPGGENLPANYATRTPRAWSEAVQTALGPGATTGQRRDAAERALDIAQAMGWRDHRRAFAHYANGRLLLASDPKAAQSHFRAADQFYAATPGADLHRAYVATQLAAYAISRGDGDTAMVTLAPHIDRAARNENAALLSTLLLLRAEALDLQGRAAEARTVRLDSLGWARYGFGSDWAVRAKLREISSLSPLKG